MGAVYEAVEVDSERTVALKVPHQEVAQEPTALRRFLREARAAAALSHPNVIDIIDVIRLDQLPVIVMECLEGITLDEVLRQQGRISLEDTASVLVPVFDALAIAHARGIIHRDFKPENIFLAEQPGTVVPKLLDFGIAKLLPWSADYNANSVTGTGSMLGSPAYMAPEQIGGVSDIDARADVWAAAIVAYEALSDQLPFDGTNAGQMFAAILQHDPRPLRVHVPDLPDAIDQAIRLSMQRDRQKRAATLDPLIDALAPYVDPSVHRTHSFVVRDVTGIEDPPTSEEWTPPPRNQESSVQAATNSGTVIALSRADASIKIQALGTATTIAAVVPERAPPPSERRARLPLAIGVTLALAVGGLGAWSYASKRPPVRPPQPVATASAKPSASAHTAAAHALPATSAMTVDELVEQADESDEEPAIAMLREAIARDPAHEPAHVALGERLVARSYMLDSGRGEALAEAAAHARAALDARPTDPDAHALSSLVHYHLLEEADALREARWLEQHDTSYSSAAQIRARIAWRLGQLGPARSESQRCLAANPRERLCRRLLYQIGELEGGLPGMGAAAESDESYLTSFLRARARVLLGKLDEAESFQGQALGKNALDIADKPALAGLIAAKRGDKSAVAKQLAALAQVVKGSAKPDVLAMVAAVQIAEVSALAADPDGVLAAMQLAIDHGFGNGPYWKQHFLYESLRSDKRFSDLANACQRQGDGHWQVAKSAGLAK